MQISGDRVRNARKASCMVQVWYIQKNLSNNASVLPVDGIEFSRKVHLSGCEGKLRFVKYFFT